MKDFIDNLEGKKLFVMPLGRHQKEFEYIFDDLEIYGYIDENNVNLLQDGKPIKKLYEVLQMTDYFIIICDKYEESKSFLRQYDCKYKKNFCFSEDLYYTLDYNLEQTAGNREIVICEENSFICAPPDVLLDTYKCKEELYGMKILNPEEIEDWNKYFIIVTIDNPNEIFNVLDKKGLLNGKDYIWHQNAERYPLPQDKKIAYYGCGHVVTEILKRQEMNITRSIKAEELEKCNKEKQYVIMTGIVSDKFPILKKRGYKEIEDFVHWNYIEKMKKYKPSELLRQTMEAPVLDRLHCNSPFEFAYITTEGEIFGCIAPWTEWGFGNIKYEPCCDVWNSIYAKIIRLSIINKTFCFCKRNICYQPKLLEEGEDETEYKKCIYPKTVKPCMDYSCNLYCVSCRDSRRIAEGTDLKEIEFMADRIIESGWLTYAENINIAGMGEVFFSPTYQKLLYDFTGKRNTIQVFSNGNLFTQQELQRLLQRYRAIEVEISMDAACKNTYEKLRRGGNWENLIQNLTVLGEARNQGHINLFTINMIVQKENYREIPEFIRLGKKIHADVIAIRPLANWGTYSDDEYNEISMISYEESKVSDELKDVLQHPMVQEKEVESFWFQERI